MILMMKNWLATSDGRNSTGMDMYKKGISSETIHRILEWLYESFRLCEHELHKENEKISGDKECCIAVKVI